MKENEQYIKTGKLYNLFSALLAFSAWGGWAFLVNGNHGLKKQFISGVTQGTASFIITLIMVRITAFFYNRISGHVRINRILLPAVSTVLITGCGLVIIHNLAGTPNIFYTIAPSQVIALIFCMITTIKLDNTKKYY